MNIRRLEPNDIKSTIDCILSASQANKQDYPNDFIDMLNIKNYTEEWLTKASSERPYFLAIKGSQVIGVASAKNNEVVNVFVHQDYHRQGIGSQLIRTVESYLIEEGYTTSHLNANLTSLEFYKSLNYIIIHEKNELIMGYEIVSFVMEKTLN